MTCHGNIWCFSYFFLDNEWGRGWERKKIMNRCWLLCALFCLWVFGGGIWWNDDMHHMHHFFQESPRQKIPWIWWNAVLLDSPKSTGWVPAKLWSFENHKPIFLVKNELSLKRLKGHKTTTKNKSTSIWNPEWKKNIWIWYFFWTKPGPFSGWCNTINTVIGGVLFGVWSLVPCNSLKITSPTQATYELIFRKRFVYDLCWGWVVPPIVVTTRITNPQFVLQMIPCHDPPVTITTRMTFQSFSVL